MDRHQFHKLFKSPGPVVLPVIHVVDAPQVAANIEIAIGEGAAGVFLINHDFGVDRFLPLLEEARRRWPGLWLGVNFLAVTGTHAFPQLGRLEREGLAVDAYWADDARIDERRAADDQPEAAGIADIRRTSGWTGLYFGGTAFKKQREVAPDAYEMSARIAAPFMDVVTTSGIATGHAADSGKIVDFRAGIGDRPLALASGVTPANAADYAADVDALLVATGINKDGDFYNIDRAKLAGLLHITRQHGGKPHG